MREGDALELFHAGESFTLSTAKLEVHPVLERLNPGPAPAQPQGREPEHRVSDDKREKESS